MFKEITNEPINKKFPDVKIFDGCRDYFGNKCYILVNDDLAELRVVARDPQYKARKRALSSKAYKHIVVQEYCAVIDFSSNMAQQIEKQFAGYKHTEFNIFSLLVGKADK